MTKPPSKGFLVGLIIFDPRIWVKVDVGRGAHPNGAAEEWLRDAEIGAGTLQRAARAGEGAGHWLVGLLAYWILVWWKIWTTNQTWNIQSSFAETIDPFALWQCSFHLARWSEAFKESRRYDVCLGPMKSIGFWMNNHFFLETCLQAVVDAGLAAGMRHFDSASFYNNEAIRRIQKKSFGRSKEKQRTAIGSWFFRPTCFGRSFLVATSKDFRKW